MVDFFNDRVAEKAAPTALLLEGLTLKIIDTSVRMPPVVFSVPRLKLARNRDNRWVVEPSGGGGGGGDLIKGKLGCCFLLL